jgi:sugar phosphate isomerase/epimerase
VKLGVFTVLFSELELEPMLDRVAALGLDAIELGTGNYPGSAHCDPDVLLGDVGKRRTLLAAVEERGLVISALSCHGNPLHPDKAFAQASHETWRKTARLAVELGVDVVNCFSGCPGDGPAARAPNWVVCAWPPEYSETLVWQWDEVAIPYWRDEAGFARETGLAKIALEPHPGFLVYNPETVLRLREAAGPEIGANFDPSHFIWQGIDPLAAVRTLGKAGAIFHVHAKDVYLDRLNISENGVLDTKHYGRFAERSWSFRSVGYGQDEKFWRDFVSALRVAGYDGVLSIEHEDGLVSIDEGLAKAVEVLQRVLLRGLPGEMWWA